MGYAAKVTTLDGETHLVGSSLYGICETAAATVAKVVTCADFTALMTGVTIHVKFTYANSAANPTLNINGTGAKAIKRYGTTAPSTSAASSWNAGSVVSFTYDGTYWQMNGWLNSTYSPATQTANGLMTAADKKKLDGIAEGATANVGTITGIKMNGASKGTSGEVDLGTVLTSHQSLENYAPKASPALTGTPTAPTAAAGTNNTQIATTAFVKAAVDASFQANDAMVFKGTIGSSGATVTALPNTHYQGWTYRVITAGTYAGKACEIGDMIICVTDGTAANNDHWTVVQNNIDGAVTGPASSVDARVAVFNGTSGKVIKDSGFTIGKSVPADAKFTDTTYTFSDANPTLAWGKKSKVATVGGVDINVTMPANPNTDTKVTSAANHYAPATATGEDKAASATGAAAAWGIDVVKGVTLNTDGKGHVTGLAVTSGKIPANPVSDAGGILNPVYTNGGKPVASKGNTIPFVVGTGTTAGTWLGTLDGLTAYYDGLLILYKSPVAGVSGGTTLNLNSLGAKNIYVNNTTKLTTHFPANQPILLVYSTSQNSGCWMCLDDYWTNSDTYPQALCGTGASTAAKAASMTYYVATAKSYVMVNMRYANSAQSAITLNINSTGAKPIYINGAASSASNYTLPAGSYLVYYDGTNYYFRTDGKITGNITGDAATVNGKTVGKDVPSDAIFTDHTYTAANAAPGKVASASAQGSSANYARQDHTHGIDLATGDANGQVKIAGTNVSVKGLAALAYKASLEASDIGLGNVTNTKQAPAVNGVYYGVCDTDQATKAKVVTLTNGTNFALVTGAIVAIKFTYAAAAATMTLNVNGTGAKNIYRYATTTASSGTTNTGWRAGAVVIFVYDGTGWQRVFWENTTYSNAAAASGGTGTSLVTTGDKYNWNNKAEKSNAFNVTAEAANWSESGTITITATGVTASNNIVVGAGSGCTADQYAALAKAQILCTAQAANSITLTAFGTVPTIDVPISVVILG